MIYKEKPRKESSILVTYDLVCCSGIEALDQQWLSCLIQYYLNTESSVLRVFILDFYFSLVPPKNYDAI